MTVSTTSNRINQAGDGVSTVFAFPYKFIQTADLKVYVNNVLITSGYTVGTPTDTGANVTFTAAPANGATIVIVSDPAKTQGSSLPSTGPFPAKTVETALDKLTLLVQRLGDLVGRTFTLSDGDTSAPSTTLPLVSALKGNVLAFNATTGAPEAGPSIASVNTVAVNTANINTVAGNTTNINTVAGNIATVNATGGSIANVNTVAGSIANVNTNAANITAIQGAAGNASTATTQAGVATTQAGIATTQAGIATTQATAAAASATAAAAAAASGLYRQVLDKSANYTIVAADQGTLFRASTGSGAVTFTLPAISSVTDGFKVSVVKWTIDANVVNVNRAGSDTINGGTAVQIASQYSQVVFVADFETNQWFASQSGLGATNMNVDVFSGNGSTTAFTLSADPSNKNNMHVYVSGVYQFHSTFSQSGTTLTFSSAPPAGTNNVEVIYGTPLAIGTPSDGTVSTAKIVDGAVTPAKMSTGAPNWDVNGNLGLGVTPVKKVDASGTYRVQLDPSNASLFGSTLTLAGDNGSSLQTAFRVVGGYQSPGSGMLFQYATNSQSGLNSDPSLLTYTTGMKMDLSGNVFVTSPGGLGYGTGAGGTVTQATSKSTTVTLNKPTGRVTMNNAALAAGASARFLVLNSLVSGADIVALSFVDGSGSDAAYNFWTNTTGGAFYVNVKNISGGSLSEALALSFAVIKGSTV